MQDVNKILIGFSLPGTQRTTVMPFAENYEITVMRNDGIACSEVEAWTAIRAFEDKNKKSKKAAKKGILSNDVHE